MKLSMAADAVLVFSRVSCVQTSVSLNPGTTFFFVLFQYGETTWKKHKLSCDVFVGSVNKCFVLKSPCPVQLQELLVWPQLGGWCASSKTDRGLLGSLWLCV